MNISAGEHFSAGEQISAGEHFSAGEQIGADEQINAGELRRDRNPLELD